MNVGYAWFILLFKNYFACHVDKAVSSMNELNTLIAKLKPRRKILGRGGLSSNYKIYSSNYRISSSNLIFLLYRACKCAFYILAISSALYATLSLTKSPYYYSSTISPYWFIYVLPLCSLTTILFILPIPSYKIWL